MSGVGGLTGSWMQYYIVLGPAGDPALPSPANCGSENRFFSNVKEDDFKRLVMSTWSLSVFFSKKETTS
eukprot:4340582-Amphidinium_carterae.1